MTAHGRTGQACLLLGPVWEEVEHGQHMSIECRAAGEIIIIFFLISEDLGHDKELESLHSA